MSARIHSHPLLQVLATGALALASFFVLAQPAAAAGSDGCIELAQGIMRCSPPGERSRDAVRAELRNAQAAGEMRTIGELSQAPEGAPVPVIVLTRQEVRARLASAISNHEALHFSEL